MELHLCQPLLLCLPDRLPAGLPEQALQVWQRSNWHWYLKLERRYACCATLRCAWDDGDGGGGSAAQGGALQQQLLHVVSAEGDYQQVCR